MHVANQNTKITINTTFQQLLKGVSLVAFGVATCCNTFAEEPILPSMVNIPEGQFVMGSDRGDLETRPAHKLSIKAFQMAKYPVTMSEFRRFTEDTGYQPPSTCKDKLDKEWLSAPDAIGSSNWDTHRFIKSDYQPVTCVNWDDINAYIEWLNDKSGLHYRLPTEQEYEYATRAHTASRFFWGDDLDGTQACRYGNFADHSGEYYAYKQVQASYVGFINHVNCDDGEAFVSMVGLYRPNPFGLFDMTGNITNWTGSCRDNRYPLTGKPKVSLEACEFIALKGLSWQRVPRPHIHRTYYKKQGHSASSLIGFRLALDGQSHSMHPSTAVFEVEYAKAKSDYLAQRELLPKAPTNLQLQLVNKDTVNVSWQPSHDPSITGYDVYYSELFASHKLGVYYQDHYQKVKVLRNDETEVNINIKDHYGSFRVVAKTKTLERLFSAPVTLEQPEILSIPGRLWVKDTSLLENAYLHYVIPQDNSARFYHIGKLYPSFWQPLVTASFKVEVKESGFYRLNYRGGSFIGDGEFFTLWTNNRKLAAVDFTQTIDDKVSDRFKVYLEKGQQELQITVMKQGFDRWSLSWLEFSAI